MENEARGKNFLITPTEAQIFHVSSFLKDDGQRWYRDRFAYDKDVQVQAEAFIVSIKEHMEAVERTGELHRAKMMLIKPIAALVLFSLDIISVEHFREVKERSSGYFDIPTSGLSDTMPIRVAQHADKNFIVTDERGYPIYE
jgi:hypothetical protein